MPFYVFKDRDAFLAAGGIPGSSGSYCRDKLLTHFRHQDPKASWRTIQHEAFHQFADQAIGTRLPVWLSEGLAEYFEEGLWTGDGLVTGIVPLRRLGRLRRAMADKDLVGFDEMMGLSRKAWNGAACLGRYDQAWSMVHFMIHGHEGFYQKRFSAFVNDVASGRPPKAAFRNRFGGNAELFRKRYTSWWLSLGDDPTSERYLLATVQTLTSFLARACSQSQQFSSARAFLAAAKEGKLRIGSAQWLPNSLLETAMARAREAGKWSLATIEHRPALVLHTSKGKTFVGRFRLQGQQVTNVKVTVSGDGPDQGP